MTSAVETRMAAIQYQGVAILEPLRRPMTPSAVTAKKGGTARGRAHREESAAQVARRHGRGATSFLAPPYHFVSGHQSA